MGIAAGTRIVSSWDDRARDRKASGRCLFVDGHAAPLGARAFDLLMALVKRCDRTVGKDELLDVVWPGLVVEGNNLQVQFSTLRKILGRRAIRQFRDAGSGSLWR